MLNQEIISPKIEDPSWNPQNSRAPITSFAEPLLKSTTFSGALVTFSGALVNATVLTSLLKSFAGKKCFSRGVLANTGRFLRFFSLETLPF